MAELKDKYGRPVDRNGNLLRGAGAQGAAEGSRINPGGLGAIAAKNKGTTGSGVSVPADGLTEAQRKMAEEEAAEDTKRRRKKRVDPNKPSEPF